MKHLHFVQSTEPLAGGGLGRAALELSEALHRVGEPSRLVTTQADKDKLDDSIAAYRRAGPVRAFYSPGLGRDSRALVQQADVVHGHGFYVATNWIMGREARRQRKPLVYHVHGIFEPWILARSRWKKRIAHWLFEDANFRHACLWRALTLKEAEQIRAQGITAPVVVCPNGIALDTFDPVPALRHDLMPKKKGRSLLFLARLHPKKGLDMMVSAWARLPKEKRRGWRVVVAGPDEMEHRGEVEALVQQLDLTGEIEFVGEVSGQAKLQCLAEADAFVLPSHSEGFSVAILEALACRLPVLATTACNFPELESEGGGWCVDPTVEGIGRGLEALLCADALELTQRGEQGRRLVERSYTWPNIARQLAAACGGLRA